MAQPVTPLRAWQGFVPLPPACRLAVVLIVPALVVLTQLPKTRFIQRYRQS